MSDWRTYGQISGNAGYIGVPLETEPSRVNFPDPIMNKLGLARMNRELYLPV
jgi:hypothetical protein